MSVLTQGTQIYFIDTTGTPTVVAVECATTFSAGGAPADQIDDTCLEATDASSRPGLRRPSASSLGLNADPQNASHILMHELSEANPSPVLSWVVGWSDGVDEPTLDSDGEFELPSTRTWFSFQGYIADFPFDFTGNSVVATTVSIQRSGGSAWIPKV